MLNDDFFDEDGNLIMTQRDIDERKRQQQEAENQKKRESDAAKRSVAREIQQDIKLQNLEEKYEKEKILEESQKMWAHRPMWLRAMKNATVPLSDPPTEGRKEMLKYKLTGKVSLTDEEKRRRVKALKIVKQAVNDHEMIHVELPENIGLVPITVVSMGKGAGGSSFTKMLSSAFQMSRYDYSSCISVDLSGDESTLYKYFSKTPPKMTLRFLLKVIGNKNYSTLEPENIIPVSNNPREFYIENIDNKIHRMEPKIPDVIKIYKFLKHMSGFVIFDCDRNNKDALIGSMAISDHIVFVVEPSTSTVDDINSIIQEYKSVVDDNEQQKILKNIHIVFTVSNKKIMTKNNLKAVQNLVNTVAQDVGTRFNPYIIFYDNAFRMEPINLAQAKPYSAHPVRQVAGNIVQSILDN